MGENIKYTDEAFGSLRIVPDFLPPPPESVFREEGANISISLRLMAVRGVIEREGDVVHLVAGKLVDHSELLGKFMTRSRDFR